MTFIETILRQAIAPPSPLPEWRWAEENIEVVEGAMTGRYSISLTPMIRTVSEIAQTRGVRRVIIMVSAQSGKTRLLMNKLAHCIVEDPGPTMWVMANNDHVREFSQKRLMPALEACRKVAPRLPVKRELNKRGLVLFDSMSLTLRGSNSKAKLQSDPIRYIFCDERREWAKGAIDLLRKRQRTFHNSLEISAGTPGLKGDELHIDFLAGSQTHFHFRCPKCEHSQPFRFSRDKSVNFPKPRMKGGMRWETNDQTKPKGEWNYAELAKTVRYECEQCGELFEDGDKWQLLSTLHPVDYNPQAPPDRKSFTWNALAMLWPDCSWPELVREFLQAERAMRHGNIEPLISFVTETLGEPWEERGQKVEENELRRRCGAVAEQPYERGQMWITDDPDAPATVLTVDVQGYGAGHLKWLVRQFRPNGNSRLLDYGKCLDFDDLKFLQRRYGVRDDLVFLDSGFHAQDVYRACMRNGWRPMKSMENRDTFTFFQDGVPQFVPWKYSEIDPSLGRAGQGRIRLPLILWSNLTYLNRLLLYVAKGKGPLWLLPDDIGDDYIQELMAREKRDWKDERGIERTEWVKLGADDWLICELEQLVVADAGGIATAGEERAVNQ